MTKIMLGRRRFTAAATAGAASLAMPALAPSAFAQGEPIKVGAIFPLSGPAGPNGQAVVSAIKIAAEMINAKGGVLGRKLVVVAKDDESTPAVGVTRANEMVAEKVSVVIEGWNSPVTLAEQPVLARANILDITAVSKADPILSGQGNPFAIRLNSSNGQDGAVIADILINKLNAKRIGFLSQNDAYGNGAQAVIEAELNKLGKPVDRTEWGMTPQTYNAYYNGSNNEIVLPAAAFAIPGLLDADADDALVYGYAGASTIGHELTHGFDDEGSQYDAHGNLHEWWSKADRQRFNQRVNGIVKQFNGYTLLDSLHINGKATAGENIADLGGIVIGLDAFKKTKQYKEGKKINGLTPTQRYFLGYALGWQMHVRDESLASQLLTDVHSPAQFRVNGPMADVPAFYQAFGIKPGQKLYRPDSTRVVIW